MSLIKRLSIVLAEYCGISVLSFLFLARGSLAWLDLLHVWLVVHLGPFAQFHFWSDAPLESISAWAIWGFFTISPIATVVSFLKWPRLLTAFISLIGIVAWFFTGLLYVGIWV